MAPDVLRVNGARLAWQQRGPPRGPPVVLVHGSWVDHTAWDLVVPALAAKHRVVTYDRRGHSASDAPAGQGSVHDDAADLAGLVEGLGLERPALVGNSFGACVALRCVAARPELARAVSVHEPPAVALIAGDPAWQPMLAEAQGLFGAVLRLIEAGRHAEAAERFVDTVAFGPGAWAEFPAEDRAVLVRNAATWLDEMRDPDALGLDLPALARFRGAAQLTQGAATPPMFPPVVALLRKALPQAQHALLPDTGHVPQATHPAAYARALGDFLDRTVA